MARLELMTEDEGDLHVEFFTDTLKRLIIVAYELSLNPSTLGVRIWGDDSELYNDFFNWRLYDKLVAKYENDEEE